MAKGQTTKGLSVAEMMALAQKDMGEDVGQIGGEYEDLPRIPTGIFEFDVASGGGFPMNKMSLIYGNESSTKTVHAMLAVANHQRLFPDKVCAYFALEGYHNDDKKWFHSLGVDTDKLAVFRPTYAEQAVDLMDSFCWSSDAGLVVFDSVAAMLTASEFEDSAEKKRFGGSSIPVSSMSRKTTTALNKAPAKPTIILINQPRTKIGVMYGDPTTLPGGAAINKFQPCLVLKLYGKNEMDPKVSKALPAAKVVTATIQKHKMNIINVSAEYHVAMIPNPKKGLRPGHSDWFNSFKAYAEELGVLSKKKGSKGGWHCYGEDYKTLQELKDVLYGDPDIMTTITSDIIQRLAESGHIIEAMEDEDA